MRRRRRLDRPARRLSVSIDALPRATKLAMLEGICETPIFVGAYTSVDGTCPHVHRPPRGREDASRRARAPGRLHARRARPARRPSASCEPSRPCSRRVWPRSRDGAPAASGGRSARTARRVSAASSARRRRRTRRAGGGVPGRGAHRRRPPTDPPTRDRSTSCVAARAGPGCASSDASTTTRPQSRRSSLARSRRAPANLTTRRFPTPAPLRPDAASTPRRSEAPASQPARSVSAPPTPS